MDSTNDKNKIYIKGVDEELGFLNSFYLLEPPIEIDGKLYKSVEHYYQAKKFEITNPKIFEEIIKTNFANEANDIGRSGEKLRPDWDSIKFQVMYDATFKKFENNENLKKKLIDTGDRVITQQSHNENFWSVNPSTGIGKDLMGKILMEVRDIFRNKK